MLLAIAHFRRIRRGFAQNTGGARAGIGTYLTVLGFIATMGGVGCRAQSAHDTGTQLAFGFMTSTWSLDERSRRHAPRWSETAIAQYRTPYWRFRLAAPYFFGTAPNGRDLGGLGRLIFGADYYNRISPRTLLTPYARVLIDTGDLPRRVTGGNAGEVGIGATFTADPRWSTSVRVGYRFQQTISARSRSSFPTWELAEGFRLSSRDALQLAIVNRPTRIVGLQDARYLALEWNHAFHPGWSMQFYATAGLTRTSPNYGVGVGGMFRLH
jgi:hypothetical protein